jgi:hypothetical protein
MDRLSPVLLHTHKSQPHDCRNSQNLANHVTLTPPRYVTDPLPNPLLQLKPTRKHVQLVADQPASLQAFVPSFTRSANSVSNSVP